MFTFKTSGVCSRQIHLKIENDMIKELSFIDGCEGNLKGISALCIGMHVDDVFERLSGIRCGLKNTSCPDQLSRALAEYKKLSSEDIGA